MRAGNVQRMAKTAVLILAGLSVVRCQSDRTVSPFAAAPLDARVVARVSETARLHHGRPAATWVGDYHTRAMQQWVGDRASLRSLGKTEVCRKARNLARSYLPDIARHVEGLNVRVFDHALAAGAQGAGCAAAPLPLSILARRAPHRSTRVQSGDTPVTGAYDPYLPAIANAIDNAASPEAAVAAIDAVLSQAASLPPADLDVLTAFGSIAASSAVYWSQYGGPGDDNGYQPMSIFRRAGFSWRALAGADFGGAMAAASAARILGVLNPHLFVACVFGGAAVGSAMYAYPYFVQ